MTNTTIITQIIYAFIAQTLRSCTPIDSGHINDSFLAETEQGKFVCQRLSHTRYTAEQLQMLEQNYRLYTAACEHSSADWQYPQWLQTGSGEYLYEDEAGDHWRMYPYIAGEAKSGDMTSEEITACGEGLARLHLLLSAFPAKPQAVYPHLYDLEYHYKEYLKQAISNTRRIPELDKAVTQKIQGFLHLSYRRNSVIHGDAKVGNMLFSERRVIAWIDLDTLMPGSRLEDMADCIRSCCQGSLSESAVIEAFLQGYLHIDSHLLTEEEIALLPQILQKIRFTLGLRYYTDHLAGNLYFHEQYPGQSLEKANRLLL